MSIPEPHNGEFVVPADLAAVAERLGLPLHTGDRVRFEVIEGGKRDNDGPSSREPWPPAWFDSMKAAEPDLGKNFRQVIRDEIAQS
jgi:hypothetical protein